MATTNKDESSDSTTTKAPSGKTTSTRASAKSEDVPREELGGVIRTSRIGPIGWNGVSSGSTPDEVTERRHAALEDAKKPGDEGYNAFKDPMVPTSTLAETIMTELAAEGADSSPTWDALNDAYQAQHEEYAAMKEFREKRRAS